MRPPPATPEGPVVPGPASARVRVKVIAFAEFVKARRAARGFAGRSESKPLASPEPQEKPADETPPSDYEPPSSQQRTASR